MKGLKSSVGVRASIFILSVFICRIALWLPLLHFNVYDDGAWYLCQLQNLRLRVVARGDDHTISLCDDGNHDYNAFRNSLINKK
jgi:hypothetical protein